MSLPWKTAWITGASSGIGRELALKLAAEGVRVTASARSADKLADLSKLSPNITALAVDVTDREAMAAAVQTISAAGGGIDLAVFCAGVWHPMKARDFDAGRAAQSVQVNYLGIANAIEPLIPAMIAAGKGQLGLVASVSGYRGLPKAAAYSPTKAAIINLAEILRLELSRHGIVVSLVNPGFVDTPMTSENDFPMPYMIEPGDAAARMLKGLVRGKFEIAFPWQLVGMLKLLRILPYALYLRIAGRMTG